MGNETGRVTCCPRCGSQRGYTKGIEIVLSRYGIDLRNGTVDDEALYYEGNMRKGTGRVVYCEECHARVCAIGEALNEPEA